MRALFCCVMRSTLITSFIVLVGGQVKTSSRDFITSSTVSIKAMSLEPGDSTPWLHAGWLSVAPCWQKAVATSKEESTPQTFPSSSCTRRWWHAQVPDNKLLTIFSATSERGMDGCTVSLCA